nr:hypothetical protein BaRGS_002023 [Batillaria attramentaria]
MYRHVVCSACPLHGVMILNKHGLNNLVEPITEQLEFQVETPFLLYRNGRAIFGIWFYKPKECTELGALMERLRQEAIQAKQKNVPTSVPPPAPVPGPVIPPGGGQKPVDILQLLSGAQQRYNSKAKTSVGGTEPQHMSSIAPASSSSVVRPTPLKMSEGGGSPVETPQGGSTSTGEGPTQLQELFKTVKLSQQLQQRHGGMVDEYIGDPPPDVTITPGLSRSLSVSEVESRDKPPAKAPLRLMSTSVALLFLLLQHDDDFLSRMHEAYLSSFRQMTGKR